MLQNPTLQKWIPLAAVTTVICSLTYVSLQQFIRSSADELPIDITQQALTALKRGIPPASMLPAQAAEDMKDLTTPFVMVFDDKGKLAASSVKVDGKDPVLPTGVLEAARNRSNYHFTWAPQPGLRNAVIVTHYSGTQPGFVVVGKSLKVPETYISRLKQEVLGGWLIALVLSYVTIMLLEKKTARHQAHHHTAA